MPHPSLPIEADRLIPQAPPMRMVSRLIHVEEEKALAESVVSADSPFLDEEIGRLSAAGLMETAAQACALVQGYATFVRGAPPREAFLVGIKKFRATGEAKAGDTLSIAVTMAAEMDGFLLADTEIRRKDGTPVASLRIKAYCPPEGSHVPAV